MTVNRGSTIMAAKRQQNGADSTTVTDLPKNQPKPATHAAERSQPASRNAGQVPKLWNYGEFRQ
jgi:hypothetical protein